MLRKLLFLISSFTGFVLGAYAQKPVIKSVSRNTGGMAEIVSIKGSNFGTDSTKAFVFFGAERGRVKSVTDQLIEVRIPAGSTYENISVNNVTSGLTGYSKDQFLLSFHGAHGLTDAQFQGQTDFDAESGLYDACLCDFDGDKRVDVAAANNSSTLVSILANTSTGPGNVNFSKSSLTVGKNTFHAKCGDLNGDGKPDLVLNQGSSTLSNEIYIFQNASTGIGNFTFAPPIVLKLTGTLPGRIEIVDLDLDGLPEIVFTDRFLDNAGSGLHRVGILPNQSTIAAISIVSTPEFVVLPDDKVITDALAVDDLNGDGRPEIITSKFQTNQSNLYIFSNASTPGTFKFTSQTPIQIDGNIKRIRAGDLDGDGKADIAVTRAIGADVNIFLNQCTETTFAFATPKSIATQPAPWGLDFGDLDGDGLADIVVGSSLAPSSGPISITILNNKSTLGTLAFDRINKPTTYITRHIAIGDIDTDGKPDIVFTSVDATGIPASKVSVFRNSACMIPEIKPAGPLTVCQNFPLILESTVGRGVTYTWKNNATSVQSSKSPLYAVPTSAAATFKYTVTAVAEGGTCSQVSNTVDVTVVGASTLSPAVIQSSVPVCSGGTLTLKVTSDVGATSYVWRGPNNYTGTGLTASPAISPFKAENAGRYYLDVMVGTCIAQQTSEVFDIIDISDFAVSFSGADVICQGDTKVYSVSPTPAGFSYKWFEKTGGDTGATGTTFNASTSGEYYVVAHSATCTPDKQTTPVKITVASKPVVSFTMPPDACKGQDVKFTNNSTTDAGLDAAYVWNFGDGENSAEANPTHNYATANSFNVSLKVSYKAGLCAVTSPTQSITINPAPDIAITNPEGKYTFCSGEQLKLEVLGSFVSYLWNTGSTDASINVTESGQYTVEVKTATCTLNAPKKQVDRIDVVVKVSADPAQINENQTSQLVASGLTSYTWSPGETLSNASIANPIATPLQTTTYTVTGDDENGCTGTGTVEVKVKGEAVVNKLLPANFLSPNGDGKNDIWQIDNIENYPQCNVSIYDDKGIKVYETRGYDNQQTKWEGANSKGKKLPNGVYYFVIRCDGEESTPRSGSLTLHR